jgi:hypothetical protein
VTTHRTTFSSAALLDIITLYRSSCSMEVRTTKQTQSTVASRQTSKPNRGVPRQLRSPESPHLRCKRPRLSFSPLFNPHDRTTLALRHIPRQITHLSSLIHPALDATMTCMPRPRASHPLPRRGVYKGDTCLFWGWEDRREMPLRGSNFQKQSAPDTGQRPWKGD